MRREEESVAPGHRGGRGQGEQVGRHDGLALELDDEEVHYADEQAEAHEHGERGATALAEQEHHRAQQPHDGEVRRQVARAHGGNAVAPGQFDEQKAERHRAREERPAHQGGAEAQGHVALLAGATSRRLRCCQENPPDNRCFGTTKYHGSARPPPEPPTLRNNSPHPTEFLQEDKGQPRRGGERWGKRGGGAPGV